MAEETKVVDNKYHFVIEKILRGERSIYTVLQALQEAVESKGKIPKSYFYKYGDFSFTYYFEVAETRAEARAVRKEIIESVANAIKSHKTHRGTKMLHDHYARLFHALAILKVDKETDLVPSTLEDNFIYNAMYTLWRADDGSPNAQEGILGAAWFLAEHYKSLTGKFARKGMAGLKC